VENLLALPRFVAEAVLLIAPRQTDRCKQTKQGERSAPGAERLPRPSPLPRAPRGWGASPFYWVGAVKRG